MKSVVVMASVLALCMGMPWAASAQDPQPVPAPAPESAPPPPPPQARERAVPRAERAREAQQRVVVREPDQANRDPQPAPQAVERSGRDRRENVVRETPGSSVGTGEEGSRRRVPVNADAALAPAAAPAAAAASVEQGAQQRPGAVRRPPSDGPGSTAPRDHAVARTSPPPNHDGDHGRDHVYVYPDYWGGSYYQPYYYGGGFYLGYLAYAPWGWGPAFYGYPYPYGYGGGYYGGGYSQAGGWDVGRVRLKVEPRDAEVWVDGYFAGTVDDFDGMFQALRLDSGAYRIEIRKPGFETLHFDVRVQPDRTITFRGDLKVTP